MTSNNPTVTRAHRESVARDLCIHETLTALSDTPAGKEYAEWLETGEYWPDSDASTYPEANRLAQSLANLEAAVRREYAVRIAELEESLEMACQNPADGCDCPGCSYAAEVNSTELETFEEMADPTLVDVLAALESDGCDTGEGEGPSNATVELTLGWLLTNREWLERVDRERVIRTLAGEPHETPIRLAGGKFAGIPPHRDPLAKRAIIIVGANWKPKAGR